jgi:acyl transferase domain-containing protein
MTRHDPTPIAVVGIGCRFAGAHGPDQFWRRLRDGYDGVGEIPPDRIALGAFDATTVAELAGCKGGFVDGVDRFEPGFFGISPREASRMDPQQRLLLETVWETLEDAGQPPGAIKGSPTGVFIGQATADYRDLQGNDRLLDPHAALAGIRALMSGFLSHAFDLRGPSISVDTACSSSLLAVHLACQSVRSGESDLALAGGVNLVLAPENFLGLSRYGLFAADGKCKFGDASADGFVRSDGVALVALKTLDRAIADSDRVYAVILGSATNNDGRGGGYLGRPSALGQAEVLRTAFENAGVAAADIDYVEAHGTGTPVGDAVELEALGAVLGHGRQPGRPCLVGSVKTNVGHTEAAAGVTGLIKTALSLYHGQLPPSLHLTEPNPAVDWAGLPVEIPTELTPLPVRGRQWLAGVNSFGISGTNAHVVLAQPQTAQMRTGQVKTSPAGAQLLALSAHSQGALRDIAQSYVDFLTTDGRAVALRDVCYSATRRQHQTSRLAVVGTTHEEIADRLGSFLARTPHCEVKTRDEIPERRPRIAFVFPGQGAQWVGMGRELLASSPVFGAALEQCDHAVCEEAGWSILGKLTNGDPLDAVEVVQPALWAIQVALAALWRSWGVEPDLVIGHSMGEVAAATVAGALSLKDAASVICRRSLLAAKNAGRGAMASVSLSVEQTAEAIADHADRVSIAVVNSPASTVISGDPEALAAVLATLDRRNVFHRRLDVAFAAHSPQVDDLRDELRHALKDVGAGPGKVPIHSTVFDEVVDGTALDAEYWVRNFREPVRFSSAVRTVLRQGPAVFLEISPHPVLVPAIEECLESYELDGAAIGSLRREQPETSALLSSLGELYASGYPVSLRQLHDPDARLVSLPTYRWQRERHWITPRRTEPEPRHPLLGRPVPATGLERVWEGRLDRARNPYLDGHRIQGLAAFPGAGFCELAVAAVREVAGDRPVVFEDIEITRLLLLRDSQIPALRVRLLPQRDSVWQAEVLSRPDDSSPWICHATGRIRVGDHRPEPGEPLDVIKARCREHLSGEDAYRRISTNGNQWQGQFQGIAEAWRGDGEVLARIGWPGSLAAELADFHFHPALLDACGQAMVVAAEKVRSTLVLGGIKEGRLYGRPGMELWSHVRLNSSPGNDDQRSDALVGDVRVLDAGGQCLLELHGLLARDPEERADLDDWLYELRWERGGTVDRAEPAGPGTWIILSDAGEVGRDLRARLESAGQHCVSVGHPGMSAPVDLVLDPADLRHGLAAMLSDRERPVDGVVHLWSLDATSTEDVARAEQLGVQSVVSLIQGLTAVSAHPRLWLVTRGAQAVPSFETSLTPLPATLWGLGRVLMTEHPELQPTLVDLEPDGPPDVLYRELFTADKEDQVALRGDGRYLARMDRYRRKAKEAAGPPVRPGATYLVTGGLGGIGRKVSEWLIAGGAGHLIVTGRSAADEDALDVLRQSGVQVHYETADVADETAMRAVLRNADERGWPETRGVFHAAGVVEFGLAAELDAAGISAVLRPKVQGSLVLHRLFEGKQLDSFVLFSSLACVLSFPMVGGYAAANAFLDALAHHRRQRGEVATSVNWSVWDSVGMAERAERESLPSLPEGMSGFRARDGLEILARLMRDDATHVAVFIADWATLARAHPHAARTPLMRRLAPAQFETEPVRALGAEEITRYLVEQLAMLLEMPPERVDVRKPLNQVGVNSLLAIEIRNRVSSQLGVALPVVKLLGGYTLAELVDSVVRSNSG